MKSNPDLAVRRPVGGWGLGVVVVLAVLATIGLSTWQFLRGLEKQNERTTTVRDITEGNPITIQEYRENESYYQRIQLVGNYDQHHTYVVAFQRHEQLPGFWIITPFHTDYGSFLVNRGWIGIHGSYHALPQFETPKDTITISGVVWPELHNVKDRAYQDLRWPKRVNRMNIQTMAEQTNSFADEIRLVHDSPSVLTPIKLHLNQSSPALHWGYAFQWLVIGALIVGAYWFLAMRRGQLK